MNALLVPPPVRTEAGHGPGVTVSTMGCKVNAFESALIREKFDSLELTGTQGTTPVDIHIVNTCTVTSEADRQARQMIRRIVRENPSAWVVVTGCYAQTDPEACAGIPGVDLVVGNARKLDIPTLLGPLMRGDLPPVMVDDVDRDIGLPDRLISGLEGRTRAFVQVQQGCDRGCTFCIIHTARGPNRSFSASMVRRQVERLVLNGYREVVLCGVDIGSYGEDRPESFGLEGLLEHVLDLPREFRLRLSSIDPAHVTDRLIALMAGNRDRVCPHLHLSLQSGSTLILKRMKRRATREILLDRIGALKAALPDLVLSADILVGFPTETEAHFAETLDLLERLDIAFPHVFAYSKRSGTPAARIPRQVEAAEKKRRARRMREAGVRVRDRVGAGLVGRRLPVLAERNPGAGCGTVTGRADNYFGVRLPRDMAQAEDWQEVEITGFEDGLLVARGAA